MNENSHILPQKWQIYTNASGVMIRMNTETGASYALVQHGPSMNQVKWVLVEEPMAQLKWTSDKP